MKYKHYVKLEDDITKSEFYHRMHWLPNKLPKYSIGDIVEFKHPELCEDNTAFEPAVFYGLVTGIAALLPDQRYTYEIKYLDVWTARQKTDVGEDNIIGYAP